MNGNNKLLSVQEVARELNVSLQTVRNYIKEGKLKGYKIEGMYRIPEKRLTEFLEERAV